MDRAITTLFMLMSVDGKISTGASDNLDVDKDFPKIKGGLKKDYTNTMKLSRRQTYGHLILEECKLKSVLIQLICQIKHLFPLF